MLQSLIRLGLAAVGALALLPGVAVADNVTLKLSSLPPDVTASSRQGDVLSVTAMLGETVSLRLAEGRDYVLRAQGGRFWNQFDEQPERGRLLHLRPSLGEDGAYLVRVEYQRDIDGRLREFSSTVSAMPGEWVQLFGAGNGTDDGAIRYGSRSLREGALYLMVQ